MNVNAFPSNFLIETRPAGTSMHFSPIVSALLLVFAMAPVTVFAQQPDARPTGLRATYRAADKSVERLDDAVHFEWAKAPDTRLPAGPFTAEWSSRLILKKRGNYTFHAFVEGNVEITLDGETVLKGETARPQWVSGKPAELSFGIKPFEAKYQRTGKTGQLKLYWSSDAFGLEPIVGRHFFLDEDRERLDLIERGRVEFTANRCNRCHVRENETPSSAAPDLTNLKDVVDADWLRLKLSSPHVTPNGSRMPTWELSKQEASDIAAYLESVAKKPQVDSLPKAKKTKEKIDEPREGEILVRSTGCLACHKVGDLGTVGEFGGSDLSGVGGKRSAEWLYTWLGKPHALNADHRMPVFKLSGTERRRIALYLSQNKHRETFGPTGQKPLPRRGNRYEGNLTRGKQLVGTLRCANCHRIPGEKPQAAKLSDLSRPIQDWRQSCLGEKPDAKTGRPVFPQANADAIKAFIASRPGNLSPLSAFERGRQVLESRNCAACHDRGSDRGMTAIAGRIALADEALNGKSQGLIPPSLNAIGDKLQDKILATAVSGEQKEARLPWLSVRMPRFDHGDADKKLLLDHLIAADRIPAGAPSSKSSPVSLAKDDGANLVAGHTLVGAKGLSCIACHQVGEYTPRNVALGTRGSDLYLLGERMRKDFFFRWTLAPQRITPGMEMPSYQKPVPGVLDGKMNTQLAAVWKAFNDPDFTAPTNPSAVEQFLIVKPGEPARIVRDVFTVPKENGGGYVARSFAVGLNNGHNILFDLDTMAIRQWTFGDFARQRTEGKSWYWDLAGVNVMTGFKNEPMFVLLPKDEKKPVVLPLKNGGRYGQLFSYSFGGSPIRAGARFSSSIGFMIGQEKHWLVVNQWIVPTKNGWKWLTSRARHTSVPEGYTLAVRDLGAKFKIGGARLLPDTGQARKGTKYFPVRRTLALHSEFRTNLDRHELVLKRPNVIVSAQDKITTVPGYDGSRLPLAESIMPTSLHWVDRDISGYKSGSFVFTSLKGHVYLASDSDGDELEDRIKVVREGLAAPFGISNDDDRLIVAHKPEVLRLARATDDPSYPMVDRVFSQGWGYNDNYHDWTCGIIRDSRGSFYVGLGSDYAQKGRPRETTRWKGKVLRLTPNPGELAPATPVGHSFRYPIGLAINDNDEIFVSDNQGVQNTFNEINYLVPGRHYGVPSLYEEDKNAKHYPPAIQVPHPWSRSVNGLFIVRKSQHPGSEIAGHGIGCEYDSRFLIRFTYEKVDGVMQGAVYYFSLPDQGAGGKNFNGPICGGVAPNGDIYIGSIHDSGWLGGRNTGAIVRLRANGKRPNGIKVARATPDGFELEFFKPLSGDAAVDASSYTVSGYTRKWQGSYATPDSGRHTLKVTNATRSEDGRRIRLIVPGLKTGHVYEIGCAKAGDKLFPTEAHYTLHRVPKGGK